MTQEYTMFDIVAALFNLVVDGIKWLFITTAKIIFNFFSDPVIKVITTVLIVLLCIIIIKKLWKGRGESVYKLKG